MDEANWRTIPELIDASCETYGDQQALVDGEIDWSFIKLKQAIHQAAKSLIVTGIKAGDRVAIWAPNTWEWVVAALGVHVAGAVLVPINTRFKGREAAYVLEQTEAKILFTVTDFLDINYVDLLKETDAEENLDEIIILRGNPNQGTTLFSEFTERSNGCSEEEFSQRKDAVTGTDLCHIMFTSGTTGAPKGAMLTHAAIVRGYNDWADIIGLEQGDRYLIINPFFHSFGLNAGILACLMKGGMYSPASRL